jgi:Tn3 transposase DDE domain-containing protein
MQPIIHAISPRLAGASPSTRTSQTCGFRSTRKSSCLFSLAHLLGIRFCPRIKDLPEQRLWRLDAETHYQNIKPVFAGKLKTGAIRESWDEIIRLAASIKRGEVRASLIVSKISAAARSSKLFRGLQEMGRLLKTAYLAEYLCNPELRQWQFWRTEICAAKIRRIFSRISEKSAASAKYLKNPRRRIVLVNVLLQIGFSLPCRVHRSALRQAGLQQKL